MDLPENIKSLSLNISEIFYSIQGEGSRAGELCVFVRLHGCMLRCIWCDTPYALDMKKGGKVMPVPDILDEIESYGCNFIEFTGGEPMHQKNILPIMSYLCDKGKEVALETNGHVLINEVDQRVMKIMDIKCPGSGMSKFNKFENIGYLTPRDEVKFVIADRDDYDWAKSIVEKFSLEKKVSSVIFSPVFDSTTFSEIVEWIKYDRLPVRFQLQMHKFIWPPDTRGV